MQAFFTLLLVVAVVSGCGERQSRKPTPAKPPSPLSATTFLNVILATDGGAYASSLNGGVWYLRQDRASRVKGLPDDVTLAGITPDAAGGAYLVDELKGGIWYLRGDTATRVEERQSLASEPTLTAQQQRWVLLHNELRRLAASSDDVDTSAPEQDDGWEPGR